MEVPIAIIALILGVLGCSDNPVEPNTDVGLRVWAEVSPRSFSLRDTTIGLRIRVYVVNPTSDEIRVISGGPPYRFTSDPSQSIGLWGSYRIMEPSGVMRGGPATDWWGQPEYVLGAGDGGYEEALVPMKDWIKRDLHVGTYTIRPWFNAREGKSVTFTVTP